MLVKISESWKHRLQSEFDKPYFQDLVEFVREEYRTGTIYPPGKEIFADSGDLAPIEVVKGDVELKCAGRTEHCVRGISGATMTSDGVDNMIAGTLAGYQPYLERVRAGGNG